MLNNFPFIVSVWAGRSAWNDRSVGIAEDAGSNPAPSTMCLGLPVCEFPQFISVQSEAIEIHVFSVGVYSSTYDLGLYATT